MGIAVQEVEKSSFKGYHGTASVKAIGMLQERDCPDQTILGEENG